jgi:hypothetical protein
LSTVKNPLTELRNELGHTASSWARKHRVTVNAIQLSDAGCYTKPLPLYMPYLSRADHTQYQKYRVWKRRTSFPTPPPVLPLKDLLQELGISSYRFAVQLAVQPADLHRLVKQERAKVPTEVITALQDIGWTYDDVKVFARDHLLLVLAKPEI